MGTVTVLFEIEESKLDPTQVCGKFLTSALAKYYIHRNNPVAKLPIKDTKFLQILDFSKLPLNSLKPKQWKMIEESIQKEYVLSRKTRISEYRVEAVDVNHIGNLQSIIDNMIK